MRRKFAETDAKAATRPTKSAKIFGATNSVSAPKTTEHPIRFVCVTRPLWDFILEHKDPNYDYDEDETVNSPQEKKWTEMLKEARKIWLKPAAEFPGYTWTLSLQARKLNKKYDIQTQKRDQDLFGMYIYNDFTGYGLQEVIQNQLFAFNREYASDKPSPFALWYAIESLAWWFNSTDTMLWNMIDDGKRVYETLQIVGLTVLSTLNILEQADLLKNDSIIPNIPLILSLFLSFLGEFADAMSFRGKRQDWPNAITAYAEKHNIEIKGKYGITGKHYPPKMVALVRVAASADRWGFRQRYKTFSADYGNGGVEFDITEMSEAERRAKAFDNKDPLLIMPPIPSEDQPADADEPFPEVDSESEGKNESPFL